MRSGMWLAMLGAATLGAAAIPKVDVPDKFSSAAKDTQGSAEAILARWWATLGDATLNSLIQRASTTNLDLRLAEQRILEARAARRVSRSALLPSVDNKDSAQRIRGGFNQGVIHVNGEGGAPGLISAFESNVFQAGFDASWEIDFFGGKRKALAAATAEVRASIEARNDVLVSLLAEVARHYLELRGAQRRLQLTRDNIELQKDSLHLTEVRAEAGLGNRLDLERQRAQLESTQALVPQFELTISEEIHALSILLGRPPAALHSELAGAAALPATPPEAPAGLPAELLKRRPDIRQAEAQVAAASARVGAAKADFFPKITLTGSGGRQSTSWSGLTLGAGNFFAFGPGVELPIFTGGKLKANLAIQRARLEESLTTYQSTVLRGLQETEDSLAGYNRERERVELLRASVHSSEEATKLARDLYVSGLADFLSVLEAQRQQLSAKDDLATGDTRALTTLVALYKALGGGWAVP